MRYYLHLLVGYGFSEGGGRRKIVGNRGYVTMDHSTSRVALAPTSAPPLHVAVIMDGNGRWAQQRNLPRPVGHRKGAQRVRALVKALPDLGVTHFTIYAFSTENWKRSVQEVVALMTLFERYIRRETQDLSQEGVRVRFIGDRTRLSQKLQSLMAGLEAMTEANERLMFNIAINYGGRDEIMRGARALIKKAQAEGIEPELITEEMFSQHLDLEGQPDPDLVVRTGGQMRISNFLLWHAAYAEYVFTPTLWPDFTINELEGIISHYQGRTRTFGVA